MKRLKFRRLRSRMNTLIRWIALCWRERAFILKLCGVGVLIALVIIFSLPSEYDAFIYTVPESTARTIVLGAEESDEFTAGTNATGERVRDAVLPSRYPLVISSVPFLVSLLDIPVMPVLDPEIGRITLYEYMTEHQRCPWWSKLFALPGKAIGSIYALFDSSKAEAVGDETVDAFRLTRKETETVKALDRRIRVGVDRERRTITLLVRMQDPLVAATVVDSVSARIQSYVTEYRNRKEFDTYAYVEELNRQAEENYRRAQEAYARFADRNQDLVRLSAQQELSRLRTEMNLAYREYVRTSKQLQVAKTRVVKERPVYTIIEPAKVPSKPAAPRKKRILAGIVFLSGVMGCGWVLLKNKYKSVSLRKFV